MPTGTVSVPDTLLGARLRDLRTERGYSQVTLALLLNTQANRVSNWETGHVVPKLELLQRIAAVYNITVSELLADVM